jgi:AraC-like DNA-binding protein
MGYLRRVRLVRAHDELHRDGTVGVAEVAFRWGFTHLGRFAAEYAKKYGDLPSHTGPRGTAG